MRKNLLTVALAAFIMTWSSGVMAQEMQIVCDEWPPYQIVENGNISGFSTELLKTLLKRMDIDIGSLKVYPWKRAIMMMEKGRADALFSANYSEKRKVFARYPEEMLIQSPWLMWVREEDGLKFDSFEDLKGKRIGVVRGYSYTPEFWDYIRKNAMPDEVNDDETNFRKLNAVRVDYVVAELGNAYRILNRLKLNRIIALKENPVKSDGLYVIFNKKTVSGETVERFSAELKKIKEEDIYQNLYKQYFRLGE